ncbi:type IV leader peptidase family protein [Asticcacaulis biprosthecium C19]|uniref:Type IV leader peptidase family protein n=1 Tax=Asticcacaulis biprosthecium C19 TaxID=715226 RepID=F4QJ52_9CAUL|nr:prepilin peptidase [Asticcacaulis biprosthecium]EGF91883.1 type IV leader peptidase family protein [Asticcacaulis biprosthecium C19]
MSIPLIFALTYPAYLLWAAVSDLVRMTISNRLNLILAGAFFPAALLLGLSLGDIGIHTAVAAGGLVLGMVLFALRFMGGGDAKLIAATALWLGLDGFIALLFYTALAGGALTLGIVIARKFFWALAPKLPKWLGQHLEAKTGIPYGIAICAGGLLAIPHGDLWARLTPLLNV